MKGFRIRLRMITFVLAVAIPHAHAVLGSCSWRQHTKCSWSSIQAVHGAFTPLPSLSVALEPIPEFATGLTGQFIVSSI